MNWSKMSGAREEYFRTKLFVTAWSMLLLSLTISLADAYRNTGVATDPTVTESEIPLPVVEDGYLERAQNGVARRLHSEGRSSDAQPQENSAMGNQEHIDLATLDIRTPDDETRFAPLPTENFGSTSHLPEVNGTYHTSAATVLSNKVQTRPADDHSSARVNSSKQREDTKTNWMPKRPSKFIPMLNVVQNNEVIEGTAGLDDIVEMKKRCGVFIACTLVTVPTLNASNSADGNSLIGTISKFMNDMPTYIREEQLNKCDRSKVNTVIAFSILLTVVIVVSNVVIIIVTLRTKSLRKPHGFFKISLAVADLINGAFVLTNISSNLTRYIYYDGRKDEEQTAQIRKVEPLYGEAAFFGICAVLSQVVTVYSVFLLSVDSFLSIRWPVQYRIGDLMTSKRSGILIAVVWIFAAAVSALPLLAYDYVRYGLSYTTFSFFPYLESIDSSLSREDAFLASYIHVMLYAILVWGIPFFSTWMLTLMTAYHSSVAFKSKRLTRNAAPGATSQGGIGKLERDMLRTVAIVLVMLTLTVLPMFVCLIILSITATNNSICLEKKSTDFLFAAYYILVCGSFINVIVYNACHAQFRHASIKFIHDIGSLFCVKGENCHLKAFRMMSFRNGPTITTSPVALRQNRCRQANAKPQLRTHNKKVLEDIPLDVYGND